MTYPTPVKPASPVPGSTPNAPWHPEGQPPVVPAPTWHEPYKGNVG